MSGYVSGFDGHSETGMNYAAQLDAMMNPIGLMHLGLARYKYSVESIGPDEVQINTPLRPSGASPLDPGSIRVIKSFFTGLPAVCVYENDRKQTVPFDDQETIKRHGNYKKSL